MTRLPLLVSTPLALALLAGPALAQVPIPAAADEGAGPAEDIVVIAERIRGQVDAAQAPVATFDEAEIQSLGASSVGDLIGRIGPQTGSGRGRGEGGMPVVLVNGQRISNFREMRNYPPEAIRRVDVLPEEVALKYGYPPDTRVVNLILKDNFRSLALEGSFGLPTLGGFSTWTGEAALTRIDGPARLSLTANADDTSPLFERERNLVRPVEARSLIADSRNLGLNLAWSRGLGKDGMDGQLTLSGAASRGDSRSWQGLDPVLLAAGNSDPLVQNIRTTTLQAGAGFNTLLGSWQLNATTDFTHGENRTLTDRRGDSSGARDSAESSSNRIDNLVTLIGRPLRLPAGSVSATIKAGYTWIGFDTASSASPAGGAALRRQRVLGGVNLALPLTSRREAFLGGLGDLSLNLSADWTHVSDFGGINSWSSGLTWAPTGRLNLQASYIVNDSAPSISQLGNPLTQAVNVPVYDFTRGETALVTVISGGNPLLRKERQRDLKLGLNWQLPAPANSNLVVEYFRNRSNDVSASFPLLTPGIETAFPGRVSRDSTGRLVAIDQRPVTLAEQVGSRLRWGLNLSGGFGTPGEGGGPRGPLGAIGGGRRGGGEPGAPRPGGGPRAGGGRGGMGGMMGMMMGGGGKPGRWSLGLYHTVQFTSRVTVAPGGPVLDLLHGDALTTGGTPRHSIEFNGGLFYKGFGSFFQGNWKAPTAVAASGAPGTSDLRFGSLASINLFLFGDLSQQARLVNSVPFLKGARVSLRFENLLNSRQKVTDSSGAVPLSYQPDYLDPRGRVITLQFRKMF